MAEPTRDPATQTRQAVELAFLTPLSVIVAWLVSDWRPDIPPSVLAAVASLVTGGGAMLLSSLRNRVHAGKGLGVGLVLLVCLLLPGCKHYDGATYHATAEAEAVAIPDANTITAERCAAHVAGVAALRDKEGEAYGLLIPLGRGGAVAPTADAHEIQAAACARFLDLIEAGSAGTDAQRRALEAWRKQWAAGDALLGED